MLTPSPHHTYTMYTVCLVLLLPTHYILIHCALLVGLVLLMVTLMYTLMGKAYIYILMLQ